MQIDDSVVSETSAWSSRQITGGVPNMPNAEIAFNTEYCTPTAGTGMANAYVVRNGVCYLTMDFTCVKASGAETSITASLPKPAISMTMPLTPYDAAEYTPTGSIDFMAAGTVSTYSLKAGARYSFSFSYPVST